MKDISPTLVHDETNTPTQGAETWLRAAAKYMLAKPNYVDGHLALIPPIKVEVRHLMDPTARSHHLQLRGPSRLIQLHALLSDLRAMDWRAWMKVSRISLRRLTGTI
jgi:hypothetical protein